MYTHTCIYTHTYTRAHTYAHTIHTCAHTYTHAHVNTHMHTQYTHVQKHACAHTYTHAHVNTHTHTYYSLLYSPTTTACGHSFCRICLSRSFDFSPLCPVCRSPLAEVRGISLVPGPSHHPVFDRLQYAKTEGGRPGLFCHVNDISVYLGRQRGEGSPIEGTHFAHVFFVLNQEQYVSRFANVESPALETTR